MDRDFSVNDDVNDPNPGPVSRSDVRSGSDSTDTKLSVCPGMSGVPLRASKLFRSREMPPRAKNWQDEFWRLCKHTNLVYCDLTCWGRVLVSFVPQ
jgi:hypothetical protein